MFSKPRIENKHQEGKKVSFISLKHPHFWEPQRIGKVSSGQWNIWKQHSLLLQEWLRGTHQEGSCGPGPLLPLNPGLVLWLLFDCEGEQGAWESPQEMVVYALQRRCRDSTTPPPGAKPGLPTSGAVRSFTIYVNKWKAAIARCGTLNTLWWHCLLAKDKLPEAQQGRVTWGPTRTSYLRPNKGIVPGQQGQVTWGPTRTSTWGPTRTSSRRLCCRAIAWTTLSFPNAIWFLRIFLLLYKYPLLYLSKPVPPECFILQMKYCSPKLGFQNCWISRLFF